LTALLDGNNPPVADPVVAFVRELPTDRVTLDSSLLEKLPHLLAAHDEASLRLLTRFLTLVQQDGLTAPPSLLLATLKRNEAPEKARVLALELLAPLLKDDPSWPDLLEGLFTDSSNLVRSSARELLFASDPDRAIAKLGGLLNDEGASRRDKQLTLQTLAKLNTAQAREIIKEALSRLSSRQVDPGLALDIVTAAETAGLPLDAFRQLLPQDDPDAEWQLLCREGGDIALGKKVFYEHGAAQCQRCHTMHGTGGEVGPELGAIGKKHDATYLLRSLIDPGADIAPGYGLGTIKLKDGTEIGGNFLPDDADGNVRIQFGETIKTIPSEEVVSKSQPLSAMPPMTSLLTKKEMRNLVAFLASCQKDRTEEKHK
jgi:quinoprotein glucose dehydrogenase